MSSLTRRCGATLGRRGKRPLCPRGRIHHNGRGRRNGIRGGNGFQTGGNDLGPHLGPHRRGGHEHPRNILRKVSVGVRGGRLLQCHPDTLASNRISTSPCAVGGRVLGGVILGVPCSRAGRYRSGHRGPRGMLNGLGGRTGRSVNPRGHNGNPNFPLNVIIKG
ncbi:MAG: hypothetical protein ACK56I_16580, partial [bacterium]